MKSKKKIKVPAYAFGTEQVGDIAQALPGAVSTILTPFQRSTATSSGEAVAQTFSDTIGGMASGAQMGAAVGGAPGAIAGAGLGFATGFLGSKGKEAEYTDFINYKPRTRGSGAIGLLTNRKLKREENKIKRNVYNNRAAVQGTNYLQNEAQEDLIGTNEAIFAANGGSVGSLSLIDHGEVLKGPDDQIQRIPDKKNAPTDSIKAVLEPGTRVLSDKLKDPDSKETFAKLYNKMTSNRKSIYKDAFAQNAEKLNNINNQEVFNQLFYKQEQLKKSKGIKPKYKRIPAYSNGNTEDDKFKFNNKLSSNLGDEITQAIYNPKRAWGSSVQGSTGNYQWYHIPTKGSTTTDITGVNQTTRTKSTKQYTLPEDDFSDPLDSFTVPTIKAPKTEKGRGYYNFNFDIPISEINADLKRQREWEDAKEDAKNEKTSNLSKMFSGIASLAPIMSNLFTGKPESVGAVYNPYATAITNTMRRRRFNIDPAIEDINRNRAISNYNMRQMNTSTGANLAYGLQSAINTDKAIANLRSMESNANNQYLGEYANTMNNLGQQWVNATNLAAEANAQNRAINRNIRRAGISQLSQWTQNRELMRNQEARDNAMLAMYGPFLQAGYTANTIKEFNRWLNKGGNYVG